MINWRLSPYFKRHIGLLDSSGYVKKEFDFWDIQLFSRFKKNQQNLYLTHWRRSTFLTTISADTLSIVDPLFANEIYAHNPITTDYGNGIILINLDFSGKGKEKEVGILLINKDTITWIEWYNPKDRKHRLQSTN